ncbi:MAG: ribosome assembly cofactor RimP [Bacteroidota bacterium]
MLNVDTIKKLVESLFNNDELFIVDIYIATGNKIYIFIDRDNGLEIADCVKVTRHIEANIDREKEDYELMVSSPGVDYPFKTMRQYKKHVGKNVRVTLNDGTQFDGELKSVNDTEMLVCAETPKKSNKKQIEKNDITISFDTVKETKGIVKFK